MIHRSKSQQLEAQREAALIRNVGRHQNILQCFDTAFENGFFYVHAEKLFSTLQSFIEDCKCTYPVVIALKDTKSQPSQGYGAMVLNIIVLNSFVFLVIYNLGLKIIQAS
jgi:hypothetical protein